MAQVLLCTEDGALASRLLTTAVTQVSAELELPEDQEVILMQHCNDILVSICKDNDTDRPDTMESQQGTAPQCSEMTVDVAHLHQQVQEAADRVAALRASAPEAVLRDAMQHLLAQRPSMAVLQQVAADQASDKPAAGVPLQDAAQVSALRVRLSAVLDQLPGLRFQLEQAVARLDGNIKTMESEQTRPSPRTVERVLMDRGNMLQQASATTGYDNNPTAKKLALNHAVL